jgi:hypothetical protein
LAIPSSLQALLATKQSTDSVLFIPSNLLPRDRKYIFSLNLTNFLGSSSSKSVTVQKTSDASQPSVMIGGPSFISINMSQPLNLLGLGKVSGCSSSASLSYQWTVTLNGANVPLKSTNLDPRKLTLPAYSLKAQSQYKVLLTVTASGGSAATTSTVVYVNSDIIKAFIAGGSYRSVPVDATLLLDASASVDINVNPLAVSGNLSYTWSCTIASGKNYGQSCTSSIANVFSSSKKIVAGSALTPQTSYTYTVLVSSIPSDGRSATASVTVVAVAANAPQVAVSVPTARKFNPNVLISVSGNISSGVSCVAAWSVVGWPLSALQNASTTPYSRTFTVSLSDSSSRSSSSGSGSSGSSGSAVSATLILGLAANSFTPGVTYTFRLSATPTSDSTSVIVIIIIIIKYVWTIFS